MTKHWILFVLASLGLVVLALFLYRKINPTRDVSGYVDTLPLHGTRLPTISVSTDDPNMIIPDFNGQGMGPKPIWDPRWILGLNPLTTTYVEK